jgi:hypothetical protein
MLAIQESCAYTEQNSKTVKIQKLFVSGRKAKMTVNDGGISLSPSTQCNSRSRSKGFTKESHFSDLF